MAPDYLIIGHVTEDLTATGVTPGGTALYSTITAHRLGRNVGLVTSVPARMDLSSVLPGVALHIVPARQATTFENHYHGDSRTQVVHHKAQTLSLDDVPVEWRKAPLVHLAPVAQEVDHELAGGFPNALVCATPQGWLREWDESGIVRYAPLPHLRDVLRPVDVMVFSAEDVNHDPAAMRELIEAVPVTVVTRAADGSVVHTKDGPRPTPARHARVVDPTGAGDVFAAAYFSRLYENGDPYEAAAYANVVASFSIEHHGTSGIPSREQVEQWFAERR